MDKGQLKLFSMLLINSSTKHHIGRRVEYVIDGEVLTVDCLMCAVCNGRAYGGGFMAGSPVRLVPLSPNISAPQQPQCNLVVSR